MGILDIVIDGKTYTYVNSITIENKNYISYEDEENEYICEYIIENGEVSFLPIDDDTFNKVKDLL